MIDKKLYWVWISKLANIRNINTNLLINKLGNPEKIWHLKSAQLKSFLNIDNESLEIILNENIREISKRYLEYMNKKQIHIITIQDEDYPKKLKMIDNFPIVLFAIGNKEILNDFSIGVVGARNCSEYGKRVTKSITYGLVKRGVSIISGLAIGIDSISQISAIRNKGKTVAVLGSGIDVVYPSENMFLYEEIVKNGGAIISEYLPGVMPKKHYFPARNRIISGLSDGILVIEASNTSGSLITVDYALNQGKNVFAVPGNITSFRSSGTNNLIKEGAKCVTNIDDILEEYKN